jgi:hypothetical protein
MIGYVSFIFLVLATSIIIGLQFKMSQKEEERLRNHAVRLEQALNCLPGPILIFDQNKISHTNKTAKKFLAHFEKQKAFTNIALEQQKLFYSKSDNFSEAISFQEIIKVNKDDLKKKSFHFKSDRTDEIIYVSFILKTASRKGSPIFLEVRFQESVDPIDLHLLTPQMMNLLVNRINMKIKKPL